MRKPANSPKSGKTSRETKAVSSLLGAALILSPVPAAAQAAAETPVTANACPAETAAPPPLVDFMEKVLTLTVDPQDGKPTRTSVAPGAVLAVIGPEWSYCTAGGVTASGGDQPVSYDTPFQIGSNTKMMTATVLLQLHEEGVLSVDDRLADHLPDIAARLPYGDRITLRQLANHTSGVFDYTTDAPDGSRGIMAGAVAGDGSIGTRYSPAELVQFAIDHGEATFEPGEEGAWNYSNTGYVLMGMIIEKRTGMPLESVFEKRIFGPLGMDRTFLWSDVARPSFGLPSSYWRVPYEVEATGWNFSQAWAAGGVVSTAPDMAKFISALLNAKLFDDPATLALMKETVPTPKALLPRYGLGLAEKAPGIWGHGGQTIGFQSDVAYLPDFQIAIIGWGNTGNNYTAAAGTTFGSVIETLDKD